MSTKSPPEQLTVPVSVAAPVRALKCPTGSTVRASCGGGGASVTEIFSVPPLPAPRVSSIAMMYSVCPAKVCCATAPGPQLTNWRLPGEPVASSTPAE